MRHRRIVALTIGILVLGLGAALWIGSQNEPGSASSARRKAPGFELKDASGKAHRLKEFKGTAVMVHFWASWCPPCLAELPRWAELAAYLKGKKIQLIAISLDEKWEDAQKVMPSDKLPEGILSLLDTTQKVPESFGTYQFPETYLLDRDHHVVEKWVGSQNWESEKIRSFIDRVIASGS